MSTQSTDPFSQVERALWTMLEAHEGFTDRVRSGNRVKFSGGNSRSPMKDEVSAADLPEVRIIPAGKVEQLEIDSTACHVAGTWQIQIATGDQRTDEAGDLAGSDKAYGASVFPVQWEILRALQGWRTHIKTLTWSGETFVTAFKIGGPTSEGTTDTDLNRGVKGWSSILSVTVFMHFAVSLMEPDVGS